MSILKKYLEKLGVNNSSELNDEEKATYDSWKEVLSGKKLTDEDVFVFLNQEEDEVIAKLVLRTASDNDDVFLKMKLDMIRRIKQFLNSPEIAKKVVENNINNLIK